MEKNSAEQLLTLLAEESGVPVAEIKSETVISSLVTDSLELAYMISEIESTFNVACENFDHATTVRQALEVIEARG